jgi:hypothetical protein
MDSPYPLQGKEKQLFPIVSQCQGLWFCRQLWSHRGRPETRTVEQALSHLLAHVCICKSPILPWSRSLGGTWSNLALPCDGGENKTITQEEMVTEGGGERKHTPDPPK